MARISVQVQGDLLQPDENNPDSGIYLTVEGPQATILPAVSNFIGAHKATYRLVPTVTTPDNATQATVMTALAEQLKD